MQVEWKFHWQIKKDSLKYFIVYHPIHILLWDNIYSKLTLLRLNL